MKQLGCPWISISSFGCRSGLGATVRYLSELWFHIIPSDIAPMHHTSMTRISKDNAQLTYNVDLINLEVQAVLPIYNMDELWGLSDSRARQKRNRGIISSELKLERWVDCNHEFEESVGGSQDGYSLIVFLHTYTQPNGPTEHRVKASILSPLKPEYQYRAQLWMEKEGKFGLAIP